MKKTLSLISVAVMTAGMAFSAAANASELPKDYNPSYYFKAEEGTGIEVLKYGNVYVNTKKASADGAVIPCAIYINDAQKLAGFVGAKWQCDNKSLVLKNLESPLKKYGKTPYADFNESEDDILRKEFDKLNMLSIVYSTTTSADPMKLSGETSDAYPLACFNAALASDAALGSYDINIINEGEYTSTVTPRYEDPSIIGSVDMSKTSKNLRVNVSDRQLGDINNNGFIDAVDASAILKEYAIISAKKESTMSAEQSAAADINGDKIIDAVDASGVLAYYASVSSGAKDITLNQFINKR